MNGGTSRAKAALRPGLRGRRYAEVVDELRARFPQVYSSRAFVRGYENGFAHYQGLLARMVAAKDS